MKCAECQYMGKCKEKAKEPNLLRCTIGIPVEKIGIRTNADRIRAMTNEELAEFLLDIESMGYNGYSITDGYSDFKEWLESEADNG